MINTRQNAAQSLQAGSVVSPRREPRRGCSAPPPAAQEEAIARSETSSAISSDNWDEAGSAGWFHHAVPAASAGGLTGLGIEKRHSRLQRPDSWLRTLLLPPAALFAECDALRVVDRHWGLVTSHGGPGKPPPAPRDSTPVAASERQGVNAVGWNISCQVRATLNWIAHDWINQVVRNNGSRSASLRRRGAGGNG